MNFFKVLVTLLLFATILSGCNEPSNSDFKQAAVAASQAWLNGNGDPGLQTGKPQDIYLNQTTGDVFKKGEADWSKIGNMSISGKWLAGSGAPSNVGVDGDFYYNTANGDVWKKQNSVWTPISVATSAGLATKVDQILYNADKAALQTLIGTKADALATQAALDAKVNNTQYATDQAAVQSSISMKADAAATQAALNTKADATATQNALNTKVNNTQYVADQASLQNQLTTSLSTKLDNSQYTTDQAALQSQITSGLNSKVDTTTYTTDKAATQSALDSKLDLAGTAKMTGALGLATKTTAEEQSDATSYTLADKGKTWVNADSNKVMYWDGAAVKQVANLDDVSSAAASLSASLGSLAYKNQADDADIAGISASKLIGNVTDSQLTSVSASKVTGQIDDSQVSGMSASKLIGNVTDSQISGMSANKLIGSVTDSQLTGMSASKITGQVSDSQISDLSASKVTGQVADSQIAGMNSSKLQGLIQDSQIQGISGSKVLGNISGNATSITGSVSESQVTNLTSDLASKLNKAGDQMTGTLGLYNIDTPTETSMDGSFSLADAAKVWFNSSINKIKFWTGSTAREVTTKDELGALATKNTVASADITNVNGSQVVGDIAGNAAGITGTVSGTQVSGDISGNAAGITGTLPGSQVSGNISGNAAGITGTVSGTQVSGNISGNAAGITGNLAALQVNNASGRFVETSGNQSLSTTQLTLGSGNTFTMSSGAQVGILYIDPAAKVGINNTNPAVSLDVSGTINSRPIDNGSATTIDWAKGNLQATSAAPGAITFTNMVSGGAYSLICTSATAGTFSFAQSGLTFKWNPALAPTTANTHTVFTFLVLGTTVYGSWTSGY